MGDLVFPTDLILIILSPSDLTSGFHYCTGCRPPDSDSVTANGARKTSIKCEKTDAGKEIEQMPRCRACRRKMDNNALNSKRKWMQGGCIIRSDLRKCLKIKFHKSAIILGCIQRACAATKADTSTIHNICY
jgi:hypothetical protein